jgi:hypothetical protein
MNKDIQQIEIHIELKEEYKSSESMYKQSPIVLTEILMKKKTAENTNKSIKSN